MMVLRPHEPAFDLSTSLLDPAIAECPYGAYETLQDSAPAWRDPGTGMYVVTTYDDVRTVLLDTATFSSRIQGRPRDESAAAVERSRRVKELYDQRGWVPAPTLAGRDDPEHKQMRALFDHAFRPAKVKQLDPFIETVAHRLIDDFIDDGRCDWVSQFAVALPLIVIGKQMGAVEEDIWRIKAWTDAWVQRLGMMQSDDQALWSTEMEIEAQHYFQPIFERLRAEPDDTLLSEIVNTEVPQWGRRLTDEELHAEMMADTFVGGAETSTDALSAGMMLLVERPGLWDQLGADPSHLPVFLEEVLRLEGPVQGLFRVTTKGVELGDVTIPAGAMVNVRYGAANRDRGFFDHADELDLERAHPRAHVAFGLGTHFCLGAALARRELFIGFDAAIKRLDGVRFAEGVNDFRHQPNFCLRALKALHIEFAPRPT